MRLRTFIVWGIVLTALWWGGSTLATAGWSYFATQEMVDKVLREAAARHRSARAGGTQRALDELAGDVRASILLAARRESRPIEKRNVTASATSTGVSASVGWSHPVITYGGDDLVVLPMSVQRSFVLPP